MPTTDPIIVPIQGDADDFSKDVNKANAELNKFAQTAQTTGKKASMSWTDFRSAYSTVLDVVRVGQQVWAATGQEFVNYAEQVKNMSRNIGASAEETSRLIQVADDVRISYESLNVAMKTAQKDGIEMSVESLARLSDEYNRLAPGVERTQFLLDKFGKSGLEMGKLMEQGGDKIRMMSDEIDGSLVLTEEAIKASDDYQKAVDNLNDSMDALKIQIGNELIPTVTKLTEGLNNGLNVYKKFYTEVVKGDKSIGEFNDELRDSGATFDLWGWHVKESDDGVQELTASLDDNGEALLDNKDAIKQAEQALKDYKDMLETASQANLDMESMSRDIAESQRQYADDMLEANDALAEALASGEGIDEAEKNLDNLKAKWHEAAQDMIYDMILVGVSAGGLLDSEQKALDEYAVKAGIKTQADIDEANRRREIADATIAGILQSEDVLTEQRKIDAQEKALSEEVATAATVESSAIASQAVDGVRYSIDSATQSYYAMAEAAYAAAAAATSIPSSGGSSAPVGSQIHSMDSGGYGVAGMPYMIGTGAQPEMFVPSTSGTFIPNADKKMGATYNININNPKGESSENSIRRSLKNLSYLGVAA